MASWQMKVVALVVRLTRRRAFLSEEAGAAMLRQPQSSSHPPRSLRRRCAVWSRQIGGFQVHTVSAAETGRAGAPGQTSLVFLHGGAYTREIVRQHWDLVAHLAVELGVDVHVPLYGLAPRHDGLEALAFVTEVLETVCAGGRTAYVVGDSAGGGLALLAAQATAGRDDIRIAGLTLIAPWLDLTMSNPGIDAVERIDPWLARPGLRPVARAWANGLPLDDPRLSPIHGGLNGVPPVDLWVGTRDITLPDCRLLRELLPTESLAGYHEQADAIHDTPLLPVPEGRAARQSITDHIRRRTLAPAP